MCAPPFLCGNIASLRRGGQVVAPQHMGCRSLPPLHPHGMGVGEFPLRNFGAVTHVRTHAHRAPCCPDQRACAGLGRAIRSPWRSLALRERPAGLCRVKWSAPVITVSARASAGTSGCILRTISAGRSSGPTRYVH